MLVSIVYFKSGIWWLVSLLIGRCRAWIKLDISLDGSMLGIKEVATVPFRISSVYYPPPSLPTLMDSGPVTKGDSMDLRSRCLFLSKLCLNISPGSSTLFHVSSWGIKIWSTIPFLCSFKYQPCFFAVFLTASVWMSFLNSKLAAVPVCSAL